MESRDKMTVNFEHMKPWQAAYKDFRLVELNAIKSTKEENILAMKSMRSGFEKMVSALAEHAGITDDVVLQVKRQMNKNGDRVDLYGRVLALCAYKVIDEQSGKNYNTIRILGNHGVHDNEEPYLSASAEQVRRDMEQMYKLLYEETYLFANEYIKKEPVIGKKRGASGGTAKAVQSGTQKTTGSCLGTLLSIGFVIFGIWFALTVVSEMSYNHQRQQQMQTEYEQMKERNAQQQKAWQEQMNKINEQNKAMFEKYK